MLTPTSASSPMITHSTMARGWNFCCATCSQRPRKKTAMAKLMIGTQGFIGCWPSTNCPASQDPRHLASAHSLGNKLHDHHCSSHPDWMRWKATDPTGARQSHDDNDHNPSRNSHRRRRRDNEASEADTS